jgi:uncharacterized protein (DUF2336 family)
LLPVESHVTVPLSNEISELILGTPVLSSDDVAALKAFRDEPQRTAILEKVLDGLESDQFQPAERDLALQILRIMSLDVSERVRETLSWRISRSRYLERDVAEHLARDLPKISFPMLRYADILDDDWLSELVQEGDEHQAMAIAGRPKLSSQLCAAIIESRLIRAVTELSGNPGADLSPDLLTRVLNLYGQNPAIVDRLARRSVLPVEIVMRLIMLVSADMRSELVTRYPEKKATLQATLSLAEEASLAKYLMEHFRFGKTPGTAMAALNKEARLTPTFLLRLIVEGHIPLFAAAMAEKSGSDREVLRQALVMDRGGNFRSWCARAGVTDQFMPLFSSAFLTARTYGFDIAPAKRKSFKVAALTDLLSYCREIQSFHGAELLFEMFEGDQDNCLIQAKEKSRFEFPQRYPLAN